MKQNPQIKKMKSFSDEELINILENWQKFASDSVRAALVLAEARGLEIAKYNASIELYEPPSPQAWYETERFVKVALWILAISQIASGILGYFSVNFPSLMYLWLLSLIFAFSILSGVLLLAKKKLGLILSGLNFLAQVFIIQINGSGMKYFTGLRLGFGLNPSNGDFNLFSDFGMALRFGQFEPGAQLFLGINFFAVIALIVIVGQLKNKRAKPQ